MQILIHSEETKCNPVLWCTFCINYIRNFLFSSFYFWTLDVSRTASSYETTSVRRLSVCSFVRPLVLPSLTFLKIGSLAFSDIVHDDSWWHLVTEKTRFKKKKIWWPKFGPSETKSDRKLVFGHFLKFTSLVFPEIAHNNRLQQRVTSSRDKTHEIGFLPFSKIWVISFPLDCIGW